MTKISAWKRPNEYIRSMIIVVRRKTWTVLIFSFFVSILFQHCSPANDLLVDPSYEPHCSSCHGEDLNGLTLGPSLLVEDLEHGNSVEEIVQGIAKGYPADGMPGFSATLSNEEIRSLSIWISERRANTSYADYKFHTPLPIPDYTIQSEQHDFTLEVVASGLDPWPYSIAPMPNGGFLLTEKVKGLRIISPNGEISERIKGIPEVYDDGNADHLGVLYGTGWILDVALHPEYERNGWIYLSHGNRCEGCNTESRNTNLPVSMCRVVRGRIVHGQWTDQETIWQADVASYTNIPDITLGGRMAFDTSGHLYFGVGGKRLSGIPPGNYELYVGVQDLTQPYGKIFRVKDDGRIPTDNPFYQHTDTLPGIWTFGHRSPQGLEFNTDIQQLWGTEMGPRGGDEINHLLPGRNYGWPLYSKGINYDGSAVDFGKYIDITWTLEDIEQPVVDLTPSPAVSNFVFYGGDKFVKWKNNLIVGSLKASTLYRYVLEEGKMTHHETLISELGRIRDIEVGFDGYIYLLLEHRSGGQLVRMVPSK